MRSSRLVALLLELSRARGSTVARLAADHGVSSRTIERDIAALQTMGFRSGPGPDRAAASAWWRDGVRR